MVLEGERGVHLNALGEVHAGGEEQQGLPLDRRLTVEAPGNARAEIFLKTYKIRELRIYAIFLGVSPWVTLELLFGKKYRTLGIMKHEMRNEMK